MYTHLLQVVKRTDDEAERMITDKYMNNLGTSLSKSKTDKVF